MKKRPAARLFIVDEEWRVLLFCFKHRDDALAGQRYWATPGGAVEENESFEQAACRELWEETGMVRTEVGDCVAERNFAMMLPDGHEVWAEERFYLVRTGDTEIKDSGRSEHERRVISDSAWWSTEALQQTKEIIYPENIIDMLLDLHKAHS